MKLYNNFLILGDFNSELTESAVDNFCGTHHLHNLIKDLACFKNPDKPSCRFNSIKITDHRNWCIGFP